MQPVAQSCRSPLTGGGDVTRLMAIATADLVARWKRHYQMDIAGQFRGHRELHLCRCNRTGLRFYWPDDVAGDGELYRQLQAFDWYYMEDKWEYGQAIADLQAGSRVLEVGCGRGAFVERMIRQRRILARGIELNPAAVEQARRRGLPVDPVALDELARQQAGQYDAACAFQVLEHIAHPMPFLEAMTRAVRPGGRLLLAVPNGDSFVRHAHCNLLDRPPHHMLQWTRRAFRSLPALLPLRLVKIVTEPLADYHAEWYITTQLGRLGLGPGAWAAARWLSRRVAGPALRRLGPLRRVIAGHTLYAVYEKRAA